MTGGANIDEQGPEPVYFVLHVPKTGGMTVEQHLVDHSPPGAVWRPLSRRRWRREHGEEPQLPPEPDKLRAVIGHHLRRPLEALFPGREIRRAVVLREPLGFYLSVYNWTMVTRIREGGRAVSFRAFYATLSRDMVARFLLTHWLEIGYGRLAFMSGRRKYALINAALKDFWFVGETGQLDRLIGALSAELDVPATAEARNTAAWWNARIPWRPLVIDDIPAELSAAVIADNPLDHALWRSWKDAGLHAARVVPESLTAAHGARALLHELSRPVFVLAAMIAALVRPLREGGAVG